MDWFSGTLTIYTSDERYVTTFGDLSLEKAQEILDREYPRGVFKGIYRPEPLAMEAN